MKKYTFEELNDLEFEDFVNDLLSHAYGWKIERFKPGTDGGIDGRTSSVSGKIIIQSKHFRKSGTKKLISAIENSEVMKALKLAPERYIFVTSLNLNPQDKSRILSAFKGVNLVEADIVGNDELNALLRDHAKVLSTWYKLWAESSDTLQLFLHPEINSKEIALRSRLNEVNKIFVETEDIEPALRSLNSDHVVVLSGEPGVGKTTLAEYLCQVHMKEGYSIDVIEGDVASHPFNFADLSKKVVYYFDDFLGANYFGAISGNQDSSIVRLMDQIKNEPNKRLILTSRSNIINKAELLSQSFRSFGLAKRQYVVRINRYSRLTKAKILYSHFWHSALSSESKKEMLNDSFYNKVIDHRNFNPRLISFTLKAENLAGESLTKFVFKNLENPEQIWDHCYTVQIDEQARILVKLCVAAGGKIYETALESAYEQGLNEFGFVPTTNQPKDFLHTARLVCNSLLLRNVTDDSVFYTHFNPSVSDYVLGKICGYAEARRLINCLDSLVVVKFYSDLIKFKKVRRGEAEAISDFLLGKYGSQLDARFLASLDLALWLEKETQPLNDAIMRFKTLQIESSKGYSTDVLSNILAKGYSFGLDLDTYQRLIDSGIFDYDELNFIYSNIRYEDSLSSLQPVIRERLIGGLADNMDYVVRDSDGFYDCESPSDVESFAESVIESLVDEYDMLTPDDLAELKRNVCTSSLFERIEERRGDYDEPVERPSAATSSPFARSNTEQSIIDDMFEKYSD